MRVAVDIGGTFTDSALADNTGRINFQKSPSTSKDFSEGIINCLERHKLNLNELNSMVHATTVVMNAAMERRGVTTAFVTTEGFRDILVLQRENREEMYNIKYHKPEPYSPRELHLSFPEQMDFSGEVIVPLDEVRARQLALFLK